MALLDDLRVEERPIGQVHVLESSAGRSRRKRLRHSGKPLLSVCLIEQTLLREARNMGDYGQELPSQDRDGASWCVTGTGEGPTNHVSEAHPPWSSPKPPHGAFGPKDPSQRPRRRVRARVNSGIRRILEDSIYSRPSPVENSRARGRCGLVFLFTGRSHKQAISGATQKVLHHERSEHRGAHRGCHPK